MKLLAVILLLPIFLAPVRAQETQTSPVPVQPPVAQTPIQPAPQPPAQSPAPVVRRTPHPNAAAPEPVAGPLTGAGKAAESKQSTARPINQSSDAGTLKIQTRLVNVALNVVDDHGAPVGGFEKSDFQIFEDGKPQTIAIFDRESSSPLSIVLAIDTSETVMTSERLEREAAKHFVRAILREQDELDLMDFSDNVREIVPFTNQPKRVETGLGEMQLGQATALYDAIFLASDRLAKTPTDSNRRRVLVLISDGGDTAGRSHYAEAMEEAQRAGVMIFSIIIVPIAADAGRNTGGEHTLIQLSQDTGGKYYYVEDPKDLEPAFRHVSDDLRTQYLLGYYAPTASPGSETDTAFRRIKVTMTDPALAAKFDLRYRTGYFPDAH